MDKTYWHELHQAYLDDELGPADRKAFEQYMEANPEMQMQHRWAVALKKRLAAYRDSVPFPDQVESRMATRFSRSQPWFRPSWWLAASMLAALLVMAVFLPNRNQQMPTFEPGALQGTLVCYGCELAERVGLQKGVICASGHELALLCPKGELWRFASDTQGIKLQTDLGMYQKRVEISGLMHKGEHLIRVQSISPLAEIAKAEFGF